VRLNILVVSGVEDKPQFVGIRETKVAENQLRWKG
jgi:hypothetical protein